MRKKAAVDYHDPHVAAVPQTREYGHLKGRPSVALTQQSVSSYDVVLIATDHDAVDYAGLARWAPLIVDTRRSVAEGDRPTLSARARFDSRPSRLSSRNIR